MKERDNTKTMTEENSKQSKHETKPNTESKKWITMTQASSLGLHGDYAAPFCPAAAKAFSLIYL